MVDAREAAKMATRDTEVIQEKSTGSQSKREKITDRSDTSVGTEVLLVVTAAEVEDTLAETGAPVGVKNPIPNQHTPSMNSSISASIRPTTKEVGWDKSGKKDEQWGTRTGHSVMSIVDFIVMQL